MIRYILLWFPMVVIAVINGTARDLWYTKYVGAGAAHQISTVTLIVLLGLYIGFIIRKYPLRSARQALLVGMIWVVLTLGFEFGLGRFNGHSWRDLLADYNLLKGRIWILVPLWTLIAPYFFYRKQSVSE